MDAQKSLGAVSPVIMLLLVLVWKKMYDQYKVKLKARVLQVPIDQLKMSFQTSLCLESKIQVKVTRIRVFENVYDLKPKNKF